VVPLDYLLCLALCKPVVEPVGKGVPGRHACLAQQTHGKNLEIFEAQ